jgi:hypothetical protein
VRATIKVETSGAKMVFIATATAQSGLSMESLETAGWTRTGEEFVYTDSGLTRMRVFYLELGAGETVNIPQGNWTGTIVLGLPGEEFMVKELEPDFSKVPGTVIAHSPAATGRYVGSPGIVVLSDGTYLATHDIFGPGRNGSNTYVHRSTDRGESWEHLALVPDLTWANIFYHQGDLYLMGTSAGHRHGYCVIRKSTDGGVTWTDALDENSGRLFPDISYHTAPMPMVIHNGRIWRAMEDEKGGTQWGRMFRAFMMSAPVDADLLKASSWTSSNALARDPDYLDGRFGGWLEGNAVVDPQGRIVNILRVDYRDVPEKAAIIRISPDGQTAQFNPARDFITFPGGCKKFVIRPDPEGDRYWTLSNPVLPRHTGENVERVRNAVALMSSANLRDWVTHAVLLYHPDVNYHGFQYLDWLFEGDDLIAVSRTAYEDGLGGAVRQHDANFLTFHRFENFRKLTVEDSVIELDRDELREVGMETDLGKENHASWSSGGRVPVAGPESRGPIGGYRGWLPTPTGVADLTGNGPRDLIVRARTVFPWEGFDANGTPFFGEPFTITSPNANGTIVQNTGDEVVGLFRSGSELITLRLNSPPPGFQRVAGHTLPLPDGIGRAAGFIASTGAYDVLYTVSDGREYDPTDYWLHDPRFQPFDGAGIWRGNLTYDHLRHARFVSTDLGEPLIDRQVFPEGEEFLFGSSGLTMVHLGPGREHDLIGTNKQGQFLYFRNTSTRGVALERPVFARDPRGIAIRHPVIGASPVAFPNSATGWSDLIAGDSGRVWHYRFTGQFMEDGGPVYDDPVLVTAAGAHLALGALPVVSPGDLTGNGLIDLIVGNDAGELLFVENVGSPGAPAFAPPVPVKAGGKPLQIQAGYRGSVQGPGEARWGYTCPTLFDWNGNGHLDVIMSSILGEYIVLLRKPDNVPPEFEAPQPLYRDGLELHLTWRTQPGVTDWGREGQVCIVTFDEKDLLRMYWRIDDHNVAEGELLRLEDGRVIEANDRGAGQRGRTKIQVVDWSGNGVKDILLGTRRIHSVPSPEDGLPQSLGPAVREAAVLLLRNTGTNEAPVFAFPELMRFQDEIIFHGIHSCSPAAVDFGGGSLDLLVAEERGTLLYYGREEVTPR